LILIKSLKIYRKSKKPQVRKLNVYQLPIIYLDGSSYALAYLNIEAQDPQIQDLVNVNPGDMNGDCPLEKF
jgi:hypothetical protein